MTNYLYLQTLIEAFSYSGSLTQLRQLDSLLFSEAIVFAVSHDTWAAQTTGGNHGVQMLFPTELDSDLATMFILARETGVPLILAKDATKPSIQIALAFRKEMSRRHPTHEWIHEPFHHFPNCSPQTFLILERGTEGFLILNKSSEEIVHKEFLLPSSSSLCGIYQCSSSQDQVCITETNQGKILRNQKESIKIPARSGNFFIRYK